MLEQVTLLRREDVRRMMADKKITSEAEAAEEVLAYMAQTKPELGLVQRAIAAIRNWLREKVHREGFRQDAEGLVTRVTGAGLTDADFVTYLQVKYGALYGV